MSVEQIRSLVQHFFDECNKGKKGGMTVVDETCASSFIFHDADDIYKNFNEFKQGFSVFYDGFPDLHFTVNDVIVEGDKAVFRFTVTGTHQGNFIGIPPTGRKITYWAIEIDRVSDGMFMEGWIRSNSHLLPQQLGVTPTSKK